MSIRIQGIFTPTKLHRTLMVSDVAIQQVTFGLTESSQQTSSIWPMFVVSHVGMEVKNTSIALLASTDC